MGWGALSAQKKQELKISPKPLFIIRGVPKWTCRLSVTPAGGEQCDFVGIFQYTVHKGGFSYRQIERILTKDKSCMQRRHCIFIIVHPTVSIRMLHPDLQPEEQKGVSYES